MFCEGNWNVSGVQRINDSNGKEILWTKVEEVSGNAIVRLDDDVDARDWEDVIWAMTTRMDPARDVTMVENTPIDYLDFASPISGLGSKMGLDATNKWPGETSREWGEPIRMDESVRQRVDEIWQSLGID